MRIGVIAAEMEGQKTGVGRYLEGMLQGLQGLENDWQWHLFFQGEAVPDGVPTGDSMVAHCSGHRGSRVFWEQLRLPRELARHDLDLVFGPSNALPLAVRGSSAVTIHDLSFELLPLEFGPRERWRRRLAARRAARVASRVFTPSTHIADLVADHYGVPRNRIAAIPLGVDCRWFTPVADDGDQAKTDLLGVKPPYALWVGSIFERRQPELVLRAFSALRSQYPDMRLVFAGDNRLRGPAVLERWIDDLEIGASVHRLGWVDDASLPALYRGAEFTVYVSSHEGFGIPPLESLACGTPAVVSSGLGLDDIWPDYPFRCRELTVDAVDEMMRRVLDDDEGVAEASARGVAVAQRCTWHVSAGKLVAELAKAIDS